MLFLLCVVFFFFFKQKTAYEMQRGLVGSEMCIRDRYQRRVHGEKDDFAVEVSVYGDDFTKNNVSIKYFEEPTYGQPSPDQAAANMNETIIIPADFHTNEKDPSKKKNDEEIFKKYGNATCRFTSTGGKVVYTQGILLHYPPKEESEELNAVSCPSPLNRLAEGVEQETLVLDISVNGEDYSGNKPFKISEDLAIYRIYPPCGPTYGKTKMTLIGTGMKHFERLHLKWGVLSTTKIDKNRIDNLIYQKDKAISTDPYENEVLSLNEEVKLYYKNNKQYQSVFSYSPKLPNWDRTHGGQMYLELGRTTEKKKKKKKKKKKNPWPLKKKKKNTKKPLIKTEETTKRQKKQIAKTQEK
eukprot:TRINITY_DN4682_c0_g1_i1.p1 TRINITY_DN4682_c0_g1~~TRINITY_DN4682_c0_g1_i1.p1  ORF type:complete len:355 (-),score=112.29 TRINITY_DN4682_c0_g1_i1:62-1126(-)